MKMQETVNSGLDPGFGSIWIQMVPQAAACKKRITAAWIRDLDPFGPTWIQKL